NRRQRGRLGLPALRRAPRAPGGADDGPAGREPRAGSAEGVAGDRLGTGGRAATAAGRGGAGTRLLRQLSGAAAVLGLGLGPRRLALDRQQPELLNERRDPPL